MLLSNSTKSLALITLVLTLTRIAAAPIPSAGGGPGEVTGPIVDDLIGSDNVESLDAIADVGGFAQYGDPDNAEDSDALPQQTADNLVGEDGALTTALESSPVKRGTIGQALANEAVDVNTDFDQVGDALDQMANNVLGVCNENTTPSDAPCEDAAPTR